MHPLAYCRAIFFVHHTAPPEIYPLSLHDALPICTSTGSPTSSRSPESRPRAEDAHRRREREDEDDLPDLRWGLERGDPVGDRKSTRLNSSHPSISYAVFCLKKKKEKRRTDDIPTT